MSFTHVITQSVRVGGRDAIVGTTEIAAGRIVSIDEIIPADTMELPCTCILDVSALKSFYMIADGALDVYFGATDLLISLVANVPFVWHSGSPFTFPLTADEFLAYVINASETNSVRFRLEALLDPTP